MKELNHLQIVSTGELMSHADVRKRFREQDESDLWPICSRFNVSQRAISYAYQHPSLGHMDDEEYETLLLEIESDIVNRPSNLPGMRM